MYKILAQKHRVADNLGRLVSLDVLSQIPPVDWWCCGSQRKPKRTDIGAHLLSKTLQRPICVDVCAWAARATGQDKLTYTHSRTLPAEKASNWAKPGQAQLVATLANDQLC